MCRKLRRLSLTCIKKRFLTSAHNRPFWKHRFLHDLLQTDIDP